MSSQPTDPDLPAAPAPKPPAAPRGRSRWPWLSLLPLGFGAWAPIYAGLRARRRLWMLLGGVWTALVVAGAALSAPHANGYAGFLIIVGWVGSIATSFTIRNEYERLIDSGLAEAEGAAELRLSERTRAHQIARTNPKLALEMGIGRPDAAGSFAAGLVDVNNASVDALMELPGVDGALATRIVETRATEHGFSSIEELGLELDLPGDLVEQLRDRTVFLPRQAESSAGQSSAGQQQAGQP